MRLVDPGIWFDEYHQYAPGDEASIRAHRGVLHVFVPMGTFVDYPSINFKYNLYEVSAEPYPEYRVVQLRFISYVDQSLILPDILSLEFDAYRRNLEAALRYRLELAARYDPI